jgi:hypothetical protein
LSKQADHQNSASCAEKWKRNAFHLFLLPDASWLNKISQPLRMEK